MSRIGRQPIAIPDGVTVTRDDSAVHVKGPKGSLSERLPGAISVEIAEGQVTLTRPDDSKQNRSLHGLARALLANMVKGVSEPFSKNLEIQGVGYPSMWIVWFGEMLPVKSPPEPWSRNVPALGVLIFRSPLVSSGTPVSAPPL